MIAGAHVIIYTKDADADRAFLKNVLGFAHVDSGDGWLIFNLPPAEVACHPAESNNKHELYFMCTDVNEEIATLAAKGIACSPIHDAEWGLLTSISLPGGGKIGLYQPKHRTAIAFAKV